MSRIKGSKNKDKPLVAAVPSEVRIARLAAVMAECIIDTKRTGKWFLKLSAAKDHDGRTH